MLYNNKFLIGIFILICFSAGIASAEGDNLWNVRIDSGDYFHSNEFWLRPWNTNYDNGYGKFVGFGGGEIDIFYDVGPYHQPVVNTGPVNWITYPSGDFFVGYAPDHQIHAWTYLYVDEPTTIYLPQYNVGGVPRLFLNYNFDSPMERVSGPIYLNLQPGENRLDFTVYDQNEGHYYQLGYDLASAVDMMSSTQYIDDNIITPDEMPYIIDDQEVLEHGHYFEVSGDWTSSSTDTFAIMITASDVTLNGGGHLLSGTLDSDSTTYQTGIYVTGNTVDVQNVKISGWDTGISYAGVTTGHIVNNVVTGNTMNGIDLGSCDAITLEGNTVMGNTGSPHSTGIMVRDSQNIDVTTNTATGNKAGIYYQNVTGGNILANDASNNVIVGIGVMSGPTSGSSSITIHGNIVQNVVGDQNSKGILVGGGEVLNEYIDIQNNQVSGCSGTGISYDNVAIGHIVNNMVTANVMNGISLGRCDAITLEGNTVTGNTGSLHSTGIMARDSQNIDVKMNTVTENKAGIYYENVTGGNVFKNDASNSVIMGIGVMSGATQGSSNIIVDDNTINNVVGDQSSTGIQVGGDVVSDTIDVQNNLVTGCSGTGISYVHVAIGHIVNNMVTGNAMNGVDLDRCSAITIEGNAVTGNTMNGISLGRCDAITIEGNTVTGNTGSPHSTGIMARDSQTIDVKTNTATGNKAGIYYQNVTGGNILSNDASNSLIMGIGVISGVAQGSSSITIDGNIVQNVVGDQNSKGILVGGGEVLNEYIDIQNNQISGCSGTGISYDNVAIGHIVNNLVTANTMNGISLGRCDAITIEGNTVTGNTGSLHSTGIMARDSQNIDVKTNTATGNKAGIYYQNVTGGKVLSNNASNSVIMGICVMSGPTSGSSNIIVDGNTVQNVVGTPTSNGIQVGGENLNTIDVTNNLVTGCDGHGVQFGHVTTGHVLNNQVTGNAMNGINLETCDGVTVEGNMVTDTKGSEYSTGITTFNSHNIDVKSNTVTGNNGGIFWENVIGGNILNNNASNNVVLGIAVMSGSSNIIIDGNTVQNVVGTPTSNGIQVGGENLNTIDVTNNLVTGCDGHGVQFGHVTTGHILNNQVTGNAMNGINLETCDGVTVEGNCVTGNKGSGMLTGGSNEIIIIDNIITGNNFGLILVDSSNSQIFNNQFNNQNNVAVEGASSGNSWNVEKISQENIMGGPYLGGNFWATPLSNGFSEVTADLDGDGLCDSEFIINEDNIDRLPLKGANHPPIITTFLLDTIEPIPLTSLVSPTILYSDSDGNDISIIIDWGDGTIDSQLTHLYTSPGVYTLALTVTDTWGASCSAVFEYAVIYNPSGGYVSGHGSILSPLNTDYTYMQQEGKAKFGFVSKYEKGAKIPTGTTDFQFKAGDLDFESTSYDWLVVAGARAQYKGIGTINDSGEYGFILTGIDGAINGGGGIDKFRIKIWDKSSGNVVYDNQAGMTDDTDPTTVLENGNIIIHK